MQITRILLCLTCVANMALPAEAMPDHATDDDNHQIHASTSEGYRLSFAYAGANASALRLSVSRSDGSAVKDAQVVIALIDHRGRQHRARAAAEHGGYRIDTAPLAAELCRVEAEIITDGQLLTDHFHISDDLRQGEFS